MDEATLYNLHNKIEATRREGFDASATLAQVVADLVVRVHKLEKEVKRLERMKMDRAFEGHHI